MYKIKNKHVFVKKKEKKNFQNPTNSSFLPNHFFSVQKKNLLINYIKHVLLLKLPTIICYKKYNKIFFFDHF